MFIITADQIDSTHTEDLAGNVVAALNARYGSRLTLPVDRNAGDEIQALTSDPQTTLAIILELTRTGRWSVGCGVGAVRSPLPRNTREAAGPAFVAARTAVESAKRDPLHFALQIDAAQSVETARVAPLIELLLLLRSRRTAQGWELFDLMANGETQADAADKLAISPQAASQRARAAGIRTELASLPALAALMADADRSAA